MEHYSRIHGTLAAGLFSIMTGVKNVAKTDQWKRCGKTAQSGLWFVELYHIIVVWHC